MIPGHVQALQEIFCVPTVYPTAPTSHTRGTNIIALGKPLRKKKGLLIGDIVHKGGRGHPHSISFGGTF